MNTEHPAHPYYHVPELIPAESSAMRNGDATRLAVVVGSDLTVGLTQADYEDVAEVHAFDSGGNPMARLAYGLATTAAERLALLNLAVETARDLYPNYLTIPQE